MLRKEFRRARAVALHDQSKGDEGMKGSGMSKVPAEASSPALRMVAEASSSASSAWTVRRNFGRSLTAASKISAGSIQ